MAARNLLHRTKLEEFKEWLEKNYGWVIREPKGIYEVLRWDNRSDDKYKGVMPIIFNGKSKEHFSCNEAAAQYVKKFIKETKKCQN
ncbi:hypothetical protein [Shewanella chilikensis]|uniref:hypothetical protein n=1 Tax=Shewanella chilikensis TaxID=558541 RepID=UPI003A96B323